MQASCKDDVFIDLGSHFGAITKKFIASKHFHPGFQVHAFEPNPALFGVTVSDYPWFVQVHHQAAWIFDGEIDFYINKNKPDSEASSLIKEKTTGDLDKSNPVKVKCVDFSKWLRENFLVGDNIILKCNIEGAEYEVLSKIMYDGNMHLIRKIYLERHWQKIGMTREADAEFMKKLKSYNLEIIDNCEI
jgi:FkbM family methyltransferase